MEDCLRKARELKVLGEERDAERRERRVLDLRLAVSGYDTRLYADDVRRALIKHFGSCGEITNVSVPSRCSFGSDFLNKESFVHIRGEGGGVTVEALEGVKEKALKLNGTDMGGWIAAVEALTYPKFDSKVSPEILAMRLADRKRYIDTRGVRPPCYRLEKTVCHGYTVPDRFLKPKSSNNHGRNEAVNEHVRDFSRPDHLLKPADY